MYILFIDAILLTLNLLTVFWRTPRELLALLIPSFMDFDRDRDGRCCKDPFSFGFNVFEAEKNGNFIEGLLTRVEIVSGLVMEEFCLIGVSKEESNLMGEAAWEESKSWDDSEAMGLTTILTLELLKVKLFESITLFLVSIFNT